TRTAGLGAAALGGAAFVGIAALTTLYSHINDQIEKDREAIRELNQEIDDENAELDLNVPEIRERRIEILRQRAAQADKQVRGLSRFWKEINNIQLESEALLAEAESLNIDPAVDNFFDQTDELIDQELNRLINPRLGRPRSNFRKSVANK